VVPAIGSAAACSKLTRWDRGDTSGGRQGVLSPAPAIDERPDALADLDAGDAVSDGGYLAGNVLTGPPALLAVGEQRELAAVDRERPHGHQHLVGSGLGDREAAPLDAALAARGGDDRGHRGRWCGCRSHEFQCSACSALGQDRPVHWLASCDVMDLECASWRHSPRRRGRVASPPPRERCGRSVTQTAAATAFHPRAEAALDALGAAQRTADQLAQGRAGTLQLVSTPGSLDVLRGLLDVFTTAYPEAHVDLVPRPAGGRRDGLRRLEIDLALARSPRSAPGIAYTLVHREPWIVVLASGRPLAGAEEPPTLAALAEWPFASLGAHDASPALAGSGLSI